MRQFRTRKMEVKRHRDKEGIKNGNQEHAQAMAENSGALENDGVSVKLTHENTTAATRATELKENTEVMEQATREGDERGKEVINEHQQDNQEQTDNAGEEANDEEQLSEHEKKLLKDYNAAQQKIESQPDAVAAREYRDAILTELEAAGKNANWVADQAEKLRDAEEKAAQKDAETVHDVERTLQEQ